MTLSELYDQFCKHYHEGSDAALATLLQENTALLSTDTFVFDTEEAYESVAVAERPQFSYIADIKLWTITATDPITVIEDKENLFLKLIAFKAILSCDITFINNTRLSLLFSAKDDQIIFELLSVDEIKALLPWAIMDGTSDVLHVLLKQLLLKTNGVFNLDGPLVDGLTPLELLSKSNNGHNTTFTKQKMLFYAASWGYFVGVAPTVENIHNLPCSFSLGQPVDNIKRFLDLQAEEINAKNDPSERAVKAEDNPFFCKLGFCVGLNHLRNFYDAQGRNDYYLMTIALLNVWNGNTELLDKELPVVLPQSLFYKTLRELFTQWVNDIFLFHGFNIDTKVLKPELKRYFSEKSSQLVGMQESYFRLAKAKESMDTRLILMENQAKLNVIRTLTQEQFEEYLSIFIKIRNIYSVVSKNIHHTSCTVEREGGINHFDSSNRVIPPYLKSFSDLTDAIKKAHPEEEGFQKYQGFLIYRYEGPGHKKPWAQGSVFSEIELPQTPEAAKAFQEKSPNSFTQLHIAVLVQDAETIKKILSQGKVDTLATDRHVRSAIEIAIENAYWEGVDLLLTDPRIQSYTLTWDMMNMLVIYEHEDFVLRLLQHEKVRRGFDDGLITVLEQSMRYNGIKIIEDVKDLFLQDPNKQIFFLLKIVELLFLRHEERSARELFVWLAQRINKKALEILLNKVLEYKDSNEKTTLLHTAILTRNYAYAEFLLETGADLNIPIEGGYNNGKTARQLLVECGKLDLIPEDKRNLQEEVQINVVRMHLFFTQKSEEVEKRFQERISSFLVR